MSINEQENLNSFSNFSVIASSIENINFHLKNCQISNRTQLFLLYGLLALANMSAFNYIVTFSKPSNSIYCYKTHSYRFEKCSETELCENFESRYILQIYSKDRSLLDDDQELQLRAVNKKYSRYFTSVFFNNFVDSNYNRLSPELSYSHNFRGFVLFAQYSRYTVSVRYTKYCRETADIQFFVIFVLIILIISHCLLPLIADVYGRRLITISLTALLAAGLLMFYIILEVVDYRISDDKSEIHTIENEFLLTKSSYNHFKQVNVLVYIAFTMQLIGFFSLENIAFPLLIEMTVGESQFHVVVRNLQVIKAFSFSFSIMFSILVEHMKYAFLLNFCVASLKESPRLMFEYCQWRSLTDFYKEHKNELVQFVANEDLIDKVQRYEQEKVEKLNNKIKLFNKNHSDKFSNLVGSFKAIEYFSGRYDEIQITKQQVNKFPLTILFLIIFDRERFSELSTVVSNMLIRMVNNHLLLYSFLSIYFLDNKEQESKLLIFTWLTLVFVVNLLGILVTYVLLNFVKVKKISYVVLTALVFLSFMMQLLALDTQKTLILSTAKLSLNDELIARNKNIHFKVLLLFYALFTGALNYMMSYFLQEKPKTAYRCTFNGMFYFMDNLLLFVVRFFTISFSNYFSALMAISMVGIGCAFFLNTYNYNYLVADLKKFEQHEVFDDSSYNSKND